MAGISDGTKEMTIVLQFIGTMQKFADAWIDMACTLMRAYLSKDPVSQAIADSLEKGNGAVAYMATEDAPEIMEKLKKEGVTCSKGVSFVTTEGTRMTAVAYHLDDAAKVQGVLSDYHVAIAQRIDGVPDAFLATKSGLVTPLDMNRYSGALVKQVGKTLDQDTAIVTAQYAKRAGVPLYMEGPGSDGRYRVYLAERDQKKMDRIIREVSKDMTGHSGDFLKRRAEWSDKLYTDTREHLLDSQKMTDKSAVVAQDGSCIVAGKIDSKNGKPIYHNGEPQFSSMRYFTVIDKYGECTYIKRPPEGDLNKARLETALAKMKDPVPLNTESFMAFSKMNSREQWSYVMEVHRDEYSAPVCSAEEMQAIAEERSMNDDAENILDAEIGQENDIPPEKYRDDMTQYGFSYEEMKQFQNMCQEASAMPDNSVRYADRVAGTYDGMQMEDSTINFKQMVEITEADVEKQEIDENELDDRESPNFTDSTDDILENMDDEPEVDE